MSIDQAVDIVREALTLMLLLSMPILGAALVIGMSVSIFQAMTQIQEQTLSFVPKIIGMVIVTILVTPWIATMILDFAKKMFSGG
ncbi:MAG TPA: flagellar biosynthetic protein FliQ [Phycisphaerales bacterium]|nr:flagellar biosynthetic protein FliQ [Phycisphaerales bacterium]HCD34555.1 flagellar biosynthetic protein FliQ [Phycisphaerales bacterium]|tara:strand:- start:656 stop:910 length:255 start_codon:yes stop_codon:yes gene_type:complete